VANERLSIVEIRTVIVQPKFKGAPIWKWVGKRFAALLYLDFAAFALGAELLEAGIIFFVGPLTFAFAHVERQNEAFDAREQSA
jgi:ABC-type uncharacterized transport system YnjBCD permease subunit